ncbi:hypothetical protein A2U01_0082345, partial [Trifolium medium]|nr:hypothetical protein [Trifolium medium]
TVRPSSSHPNSLGGGEQVGTTGRSGEEEVQRQRAVDGTTER